MELLDLDLSCTLSTSLIQTHLRPASHTKELLEKQSVVSCNDDYPAAPC